MENHKVHLENIEIDQVLKYVNAKSNDEGSFALQWRFERELLADDQVRMRIKRFQQTQRENKNLIEKKND